MIRKIALAIFIVVVVVGGLVGIKGLQFGKLIAQSKTSAPPPESVSTTNAWEERWQSSLTAIGSIAAAQGVVITPQLAGAVSKIAFESGSLVDQGALLVQLDTSSEEAQLRAVKAQVKLAQVNLERALNLRTNNMTSQAEVDTADATLKQFEANADAIQTTIDKKTIRAPFAGQLGIRMVNLGQYLETGKPIVSLQSLAPVYADFTLPQQCLDQLKPGMKVRVETDAYPNRTFEGSLTAINPDLDPSTRSIGLQATFDNADKALRPGMFARVEVLLPQELKVIVLPATAVLSAPYGDSVYVVEQQPASTNGPGGLVVRQQLIKTGRQRGDLVSVVEGVQPGQKVVRAGMFKLRPGMVVQENNALVPPTTATPHPENK